MKTLLFPALLFTVSALAAQTFQTPRLLAVGAADVAQPGSQPHLSNPAGSAFLKNERSIELASSLPFSQLDWKKTTVSGSVSVGKTAQFGAAFCQNGFDGFRVSTVRLAYGRKVAANLGFGAAVDFLKIRAVEHGQTSGLSFGVGLLAQASKTVSLGCFVQNPMQLKLKNGAELPTGLRIGLAWQSSPSLSLMTETEKNLFSPAVFKLGIEQRFAERIKLRAGFRTGPMRFGFGGQMLLKKRAAMEFGFEAHPILGITPAAAFRFDH